MLQPQPPPNAYAVLEDSFAAHLTDTHRQRRQLLPAAAAPLQLWPADTPSDHESTDTDSPTTSQRSTPLASPRALHAVDNGLPPTPPTASRTALESSSPPNRRSVISMVGSIASQKSALSTPVNARSPPTPDPSPPHSQTHTDDPHDHHQHTHLAVQRPPLFPYPSSRAESFTTAREDLSSEPSISPSPTPLVDPLVGRLSVVDEDRGLGLAFENDNDVTPTERPRFFYPIPGAEQDIANAETTAGANEDNNDFPIIDNLPDQDWNTDLMRNVTVRRKLKPEASQGPSDSTGTIIHTPTADKSRRSSGLRQRVQASNSPRSPSVEDFAHAIGWPVEVHHVEHAPIQHHVEHDPHIEHHVDHTDPKSKRMSTASIASTVVAAVVITTPPQRQRTLRHSGKNLALRRDSNSPLHRLASPHSTRNSLLSDDVPLHKLVHKNLKLAGRNNRYSTDSDTLGALSSIGTARNASPFSIRSSRTIDSSVYTIAHQESVRNVLQPAADILSKSNLHARPDKSPHMRISSAPETVRHVAIPAKSRGFVEVAPSPKPLHARSPIQSPQLPYASRTPVNNVHRRTVSDSSRPDMDKPLPRNPLQDVIESEQRKLSVYDSNTEDNAPPPALLDRVRLLVAEREAQNEVVPSPTIDQMPASPTRHQSLSSPSQLSPSQLSPPTRRVSRSSRGRSEEQRRSSHSQDRTSPSQDPSIRRSLDQTTPDDFSRRSYDWQRRTPDEHRRISFDRSTGRTEEHANARHLYSQSTPFSQFSDTPIEVSEATAVSIYPHNNNSLLVVQQPSRVNSMLPESRQLTNSMDDMADGTYFDSQDGVELRQELLRTPTPPFVDAMEVRQSPAAAAQPTLTVEPSTPPMQMDLFQPAGVDSPLTNPRTAPEPPKIMFIPPTPAEELERTLEVGPPGPPKHSDSHPQRRLSLVQRARRYSDNLISPFLARTSSRDRHDGDSHSRSESSHRAPDVPTVNDEDGTLHPFWRPRGFWDDFEDSDSGDEDHVLPYGGDTSDVEDPAPEPEPYPRRNSTLRKRLTSGFSSSGGFLIGNSLGVERHGTNRKRHHVTLPPHFPSSPQTSHASSPRMLNQSPMQPLRPQSSGIRKSGSASSLRSSASFERSPRRQSWRKGKAIPGLKGYQVQYIGVSGIKDRLKERTAEKRRDKIRKSIGSRYYVEPNPMTAR